MKKFIDIDDVLVILGGLMIGAGIWFIYWPATLISLGLAFTFLGIRGSRIRRNKNG